MAKENIVTETKKFLIVGTLSADDMLVENPNTGTIAVGEILGALDGEEVKITKERNMETPIEHIEE